MLHLNLVSKELKKEIRLGRIYEVLKHINLVLIVITIVIAVIILTAKIILQDNFNKVVEQTTLMTKNSQGRNTEVRDINARLKYVAKIQDDFVVWSSFLEEISKYTNSNIIFSSIEIDKDKNKISFRGKANFRDDLIKLKDGLEASEVFYDIDFPRKNILEKENVDFQITASFNLKKL